MQKYTLYFKDKDIEEKYQNIVQKSFRLFTLNVVTIAGLLLNFAKLIEQSIAGEKTLIVTYSIVLCYILIQYWLAQKHKNGVRIAIFILNHIISVVFNVQINDAEDYHYAFLRGSNIMGANFLLSLSGEFLDAVFSSLSTTLIRLLMVLLRSQKLELSTLLSTLLVGLIICRYLYHFHKAARSQFLLTLNDSHWEKVLKSIAFRQPYFLFTFQEENLNFQLIQDDSYQSIFKQQIDGVEFLKEAKHQGIQLENYLYKLIKQYSVERIQFFNTTLIVQYFKQLVRIEFSIFQGNKPSVLILIRDYLQKDRQDLSLYQKRNQQLTKLLSKVIRSKGKVSQSRIQMIYLQRGFIQFQLLENIKQCKFKQVEMNLLILIHYLKHLYSHLSIKVLGKKAQSFITIPNIFILVILFIVEQTLSDQLLIYFDEEDSQSLQFQGGFNVDKLRYKMLSVKDYLRLIFEKQNIEEHKINFELNKEILIPFCINEIATESRDEINLY